MAQAKPKIGVEYLSAPKAVACTALVRTADRVKNYLETLVAPFDITARQYNVLLILRGAEPEGLPTFKIAGRLIERAPGITRMIDRLAAKGLVGRQVRPADRRRVYCRITGKGLNLLELLDTLPAEINRVFDVLEETELAQMTMLLDRLSNALESELKIKVGEE